ncbi:histidine phosphatase family protein [Niallia sp. NCCP-28]|uniref:histidine phosphatase family protein n=1 Tax=Niallia sp. NCCP-28 TaxID=2934712 RepID=UPI00207F4F0A|nr:histidine phosphatase family protein [Niallia sp. NCCP-28]GKU80628.1 phosphoglycerate mutase [Niallia sp. NCCP-28]
MKKTIYLIRHCQANGQESDAALTELGWEQANKLADCLADVPVDRIISSPFLRAVQSLTPYAENNDRIIQMDNRLSERILSSVSYADWMEKLEATFLDMDLKFIGGESSREAMNRIAEVIEEVQKSEDSNVIMVTHGNIMSLLLNYYDKNFGFKEWENLKNPDIFLLEVAKSGCHIKRFLNK